MYCSTLDAGHHFKSFVKRIDELDAENLYCKFTIFECETFLNNVESILVEIKYIPVGSGCKYKMTAQYQPKPGCYVNKDEVEQSEARINELMKKFEEYLLTNPEYCA